MKKLFLLYLTVCLLLPVPSARAATRADQPAAAVEAVQVAQEADRSAAQKLMQRRNVPTKAPHVTQSKVYVPYEKLDSMFTAGDKGVYIPYSDFLKLWEAATKTEPEDEVPPPPVEAAIIRAEYTGTVSEELAEFEATLRVSALKEEWAKLILNVNDIAVTALSIDGKTPLINAAPGGLELVLPKKGEYDLKMSFSTKVSTAPGEKFVAFQIPSSPLTKLDMRIPGTDLDVKIEPMLSQKSTVSGDSTQFSAFLSPEGKVNVRWLAKSVDDEDQQSVFFAKVTSEIFVKESVYQIDTGINISVVQNKAESFRVRIPEGISLVSVDGKNIKDWDLAEDRVLTVNLYEEVEDNFAFAISTERYRDMDEAAFTVPQFEVIDAKREDGEIIIKAEPTLRVQVDKKERVTQIDPSELQGRINFANFVSAFKYFRRPYTIALAISKIEPKITVDQQVLVAFSETIIDYYAYAKFTVKDAGVFKFRFAMPDGFRVVEVGNEATVDSYDVADEEGQPVLTVVLKNKAMGEFALPVHLEADKEDKDIALDLPKLINLEAEKDEGVIALALRKNLKLTTEDMRSLRPMSLEELQAIGIRVRDPKNEMAAGYRYSTTDYASQLNVNKRETKIIAQVVRVVDIQETAMKVNDTINYQVLYAPVSQFQVQYPAAVAKDAVITGNNIKEKRLSVDPKAGVGIWTVALHAPVLNNFVLNVTLEQKLPSIRIGEQRGIELPPIIVKNVFNESGVIAVGKSPTLQVESEESNLEPIDTKELPGNVNRAQSVLAFRYLSHPYRLALITTKHEYEKVLDAVVNQAHFDIVLSKEGVAKTEGVFRIMNTNRQSLALTMPAGTDKIYAVFISGKKASISIGKNDREKIVMLPKDINPGQEFTLRIIYQTKIKKKFGFLGGLRVENAEFSDIPTSKITWRLFLPRDYSYPRMHGSMNPDRYEGPQPLLESAVRSQVVRGQQRVRLEGQKIPRQNDEPTLYGLDIDIVREGQMFQFSKLDKNAYLKVGYVKRDAVWPICLVVLALTGWLFMRIHAQPEARRKRNMTIFLAAILVLNVLLPQGFKLFGALMIIAVAACMGYLLFIKLRQGNLFKKKQGDGE
ncbi:MAG: hypothetical protein KC897_03145 [Candidatus Omnitrophica bacterium]|nr:hypothetical protein [Candidatus Omnitrophota bacterium]MCB9720918.1 hypothetical protein [Candidatus Omnitrophota bacterium]